MAVCALGVGPINPECKPHVLWSPNWLSTEVTHGTFEPLRVGSVLLFTVSHLLTDECSLAKVSPRLDFFILPFDFDLYLEIRLRRILVDVRPCAAPLVSLKHSTKSRKLTQRHRQRSS